jgi:hypothetical protein
MGDRMAQHRRPMPNRAEMERLGASVLVEKLGISPSWALVVIKPVLDAALLPLDEGIIEALRRLREDA